MGGGVLLVVLAVLWAVVLIPMLLTRHDNTDETKQVDRFRRAMTSLSRGDKAADPLRMRRNQAVREAAARRRRTTYGLLGVNAMCFVAAMFGYFPIPLLVLPVAIILGWLALAIRASSRMPQRASVRTTGPRPVAATPRTRYVTPPAVHVMAYEPDIEAVDEDYLEATGTDERSWAPVPHQVPRNVRASGVSGEIIARASSWSKAVLDDVRARTTSVPVSASASDVGFYEVDEPAAAPLPRRAPVQPAQPSAIYDDEDPPTAEIPIIRRAAGA